jgi:hypothetical protein
MPWHPTDFWLVFTTGFLVGSAIVVWLKQS